MAKPKDPKENAFLPLEDMPCRLGKFSNNLVMEAAEDDEEDGEEVGVFTFPITEIMLPKEMIVALWGDKYAHDCWYATSKGVLSPMPWISQLPDAGKDLPPGFTLAKKFDQAEIELAYAESPSRNTKRDTFEGCKIGRILCVPRPGTSGATEVRLHVQLKPGLGDENLRLQEYQNRRIAITVRSAAVAQKRNAKQAELGLQGGGPGAERKPTDDGEGVGAGFAAAAAKAQAEAWNKGRPIPVSDDEPPHADTH